MSYRKDIITAITALKEGSCSDPTSVAIKKQVQANLPMDKKWNITAFLNDFKKLTQCGHLVRSKGGYIKFSTDFENKLLEKESAAAEQERLKVEAAVTRQGRKRSKIEAVAAKLKSREEETATKKTAKNEASKKRQLEEEAFRKKIAEKKRFDEAAKARERAHVLKFVENSVASSLQGRDGDGCCR